MQQTTALPADASVPVWIPEAYGGMAECHGALRLVADGLQLEFQAREGFLGLLKGGVKEVSIPWPGLVDLKLQAGWFKTRLLLVVKSVRSLDGVPGATGSHVVLGVERKYRTLARQLVFAVNLRLCEQEIRKAGEPPPAPAGPV
jgi:hypothetical protein